MRAPSPEGRRSAPSPPTVAPSSKPWNPKRSEQPSARGTGGWLPAHRFEPGACRPKSARPSSSLSCRTQAPEPGPPAALQNEQRECREAATGRHARAPTFRTQRAPAGLARGRRFNVVAASALGRTRFGGATFRHRGRGLRRANRIRRAVVGCACFRQGGRPVRKHHLREFGVAHVGRVHAIAEQRRLPGERSVHGDDGRSFLRRLLRGNRDDRVLNHHPVARARDVDAFVMREGLARGRVIEHALRFHQITRREALGEGLVEPTHMLERLFLSACPKSMEAHRRP